jgi:hypothetical protein
MTLTAEQETALEALLAQLPEKGAQPATPAGPAAVGGASLARLVEAWLGISGADVRGALDGLLARKDGLEAQLRQASEAQPMDTAFGFLAAATLAFYSAERGANPKINTIVDAFYYISTCASVGYADVFAVTPAGRTIASLVMTLGPALTSRILNRPGAAQE